MNPVHQIGRYQLPLLNVVAIVEREDNSGYTVLLVHGHTIYFTKEEKEAYDKAMELHGQILNFWGMCKSAGLRA